MSTLCQSLCQRCVKACVNAVSKPVSALCQRCVNACVKACVNTVSLFGTRCSEPSDHFRKSAVLGKHWKARADSPSTRPREFGISIKSIASSLCPRRQPCTRTHREYQTQQALSMLNNRKTLASRNRDLVWPSRKPRESGISIRNIDMGLGVKIPCDTRVACRYNVINS